MHKYRARASLPANQASGAQVHKLRQMVSFYRSFVELFWTSILKFHILNIKVTYLQDVKYQTANIIRSGDATPFFSSGQDV